MFYLTFVHLGLHEGHLLLNLYSSSRIYCSTTAEISFIYELINILRRAEKGIDKQVKKCIMSIEIKEEK